MPGYVVWTQSRPNRPIFIVWLAITVGINMLALIVIDAIFSGVEIGRWAPLIVGAVVLTLGNAFLKPILALLTLPLIIITLGLGYFALNVGMLALAEWIAGDFSIDGFWTYVGATIVVWFVNVVMQAVLGRISGEDVRRPAARI